MTSTDNLITFFKGSLAKYNSGVQAGKYANDIYFVTDAGQGVIYAQGIAYGLNAAQLTALNEVVDAEKGAIVNTQYDSVNHKLVLTYSKKDVNGNDQTADVIIPLVEADGTAPGLMSVADKAKLDAIEAGGQVNILEAVATDATGGALNYTDEYGSEHTISDITVTAPSEDNGKTATINIVNTLSGYARKAETYTKKAIDDIIAAKTTAVYRPMGSVADAAALQAIVDATPGDVYSVIAAVPAGTITIVGGTQNDEEYPEGTNFVWVEWADGTEGWDALSGQFDTTDLQNQISDNKDAINQLETDLAQEVIDRTTADSFLDSAIGAVETKIGVAQVDGADVMPDSGTSENNKTVHQRINELRKIITDLDLGSGSLDSLVLAITNSYYVAETHENQPKVHPALAEIVAALSNNTYAKEGGVAIDSFYDVAHLINELNTQDTTNRTELEGLLSALETKVNSYSVNGKKFADEKDAEGNVDGSIVLSAGDILISDYSKLNVAEPAATLEVTDTISLAIAKLEKNIALNSNNISGVSDAFEQALSDLKGEGWGNALVDDNGVSHDATLVGLKEYIDAQDDKVEADAKAYTDEQIGLALKWYEAE